MRIRIQWGSNAICKSTHCTVVVSSRVSTGSQGLPWILERRTTGAPFASVWRHVHACARRAWALARTRRPVFPDRRAAEAGAVQIKQKRFSAPPDRFWPGAACHPWILPACSAAAFASAFTKKKGVAYSLAGCYFFPLALLPDQTATSLSSPSVALQFAYI